MITAACAAPSGRAGDLGGGAPPDAAPDGSESGGGALVTLAMSDAAYLEGQTGPRILVRGTRAAREPFSVEVELLDARGEPAAYDPDGDGVPEESRLEVEGPAGEGPRFLVELVAARGLDRVVRAVRLTLRDRSGNARGARTASLAAPVVRARGEACDEDGFDRCGAGLVCAGAASGDLPAASHACQPLATLRARACAEAPVLEPDGPPLRGATGGASLWDPPEGCASSERRERPEALARLHVPRFAPSITLSTASPATAFDTVVYVTGGCDGAAPPLACNDDGSEPPSSTVVLRDVAPGDYVVVVDGLAREGGAFELRATTR